MTLVKESFGLTSWSQSNSVNNSSVNNEKNRVANSCWIYKRTKHVFLIGAWFTRSRPSRFEKMLILHEQFQELPSWKSCYLHLLTLEKSQVLVDMFCYPYAKSNPEVTSCCKDSNFFFVSSSLSLPPWEKGHSLLSVLNWNTKIRMRLLYW